VLGASPNDLIGMGKVQAHPRGDLARAVDVIGIGRREAVSEEACRGHRLLGGNVDERARQAVTEAVFRSAPAED
jgi:hypothetical protein